jgi:hypothetical protein
MPFSLANKNGRIIHHNLSRSVTLNWPAPGLDDTRLS